MFVYNHILNFLGIFINFGYIFDTIPHWILSGHNNIKRNQIKKISYWLHLKPEFLHHINDVNK